MTDGSDRLDRVERILEQVARSQEQVAKSQEVFAKNQEQFAKGQEQFAKGLEQVDKALKEMAARQQYHDEAFERHDTEMKAIREAIAIDAENIRALVRIAEIHNRRLEGLEGGEPS
jgi:methyl-accepting chemotaxis protein